VSWTRDAFIAIKRIIMLEERIVALSKQSQELMEACRDLDRRLVRIEAKFELLERMAAPRRHSLPEKIEE
jgi:hypothetical protein